MSTARIDSNGCAVCSGKHAPSLDSGHRSQGPPAAGRAPPVIGSVAGLGARLHLAGCWGFSGRRPDSPGHAADASVAAGAQQRSAGRVGASRGPAGRPGRAGAGCGGVGAIPADAGAAGGSCGGMLCRSQLRRGADDSREGERERRRHGHFVWLVVRPAYDAAAVTRPSPVVFTEHSQQERPVHTAAVLQMALGRLSIS